MNGAILLVGLPEGGEFSQTLRRLNCAPQSVDAGWQACEALEREGGFELVVVAERLADISGRTFVEETLDRPGPPRMAWAGGPPTPEGLELALGADQTEAQWAAQLARWIEERKLGLSAELERLRTAYRQTLPAKLAELRRTLAEVDRGEPALREAADLAHRLAGTAGAYGQPEIGEVIRRLEQHLATLPPDARVPALAWALLEEAEARLRPPEGERR